MSLGYDFAVDFDFEIPFVPDDNLTGKASGPFAGEDIGPDSVTSFDAIGVFYTTGVT